MSRVQFHYSDNINIMISMSKGKTRRSLRSSSKPYGNTHVMTRDLDDGAESRGISIPKVLIAGDGGDDIVNVGGGESNC